MKCSRQAGTETGAEPLAAQGALGVVGLGPSDRARRRGSGGMKESDNRPMGLQQRDETERKFDVGPETIFPTLNDVDGVSAVSQPADLELEAVYFDTHDLDLARHGGNVAGEQLVGTMPDGTSSFPRPRTPPPTCPFPWARATKTVPKVHPPISQGRSSATGSSCRSRACSIHRRGVHARC